MADTESSQRSSGWKGPDVPVWKGLLFIAVVLVLVSAVTVSGIPRLLGLALLVILVVVTARWWKPLFQGPDRKD